MAGKRIVHGIFIFLLILNCGFPLAGQQLIFEKHPDDLVKKPENGPNRKNFTHAFLSAALIMPQPGVQSIHTNQPFTGEAMLGVRYKRKLTKLFSVLTEAGLDNHFFNFGQHPGVFLSDSLTHHSQTIFESGFSGGAGIRTRFGQRGDYLGNYVDVGMTVNVSVIRNLRTTDLVNVSGSTNVLSERTTISQPIGMNRVCYSAFIRIGFDQVSIVASYRLTSLFDYSSGKDLPGLQLGLELSPFIY